MCLVLDALVDVLSSIDALYQCRLLEVCVAFVETLAVRREFFGEEDEGALVQGLVDVFGDLVFSL